MFDWFDFESSLASLFAEYLCIIEVAAGRVKALESFFTIPAATDAQQTCWNQVA
jgi:hypothetical protein